MHLYAMCMQLNVLRDMFDFSVEGKMVIVFQVEYFGVSERFLFAELSI
jgi:hypothetical protein